jgi:fatty-acid desaturase
MNESAMKHPFAWFNLGFIGAVHLFAFAGIFVFSWKAFAVAVVLYWVTGSLGIGLGFHRLLTHQGFDTPRWVKYFLTVCGTIAVQGGPIAWVAGHRMHHAHSDKDLDPHDSRKGFWWAHMGWLLRRDPRVGEFENYRNYAKDLVADPFILFLDRNFVWVQVGLGLLLLAWGGWSFAIWGVFVRLAFTWHCTWLVNSAAHMFGYKTYDSRDDSRNCWWVALLSFGEGWHNNHHAFPRSARHGLAWWEFDMNYLALKLLESLGLAWNIRVGDHLRAARGNRSALAA